MVDTPITNLPVNSPLTGEEAMEIAQLSPSVTISAATISAQASDNSFNDSGSGFIAAGFAVDDYVHVTGFTGNTANNIFSGKVTALTAGKMTIGGTDGDVIVDDAAGETVTISKWVSSRMDVSGLGGGGAWALAGSWSHSVNVTEVDFTGLAGASDILVLAVSVVSSSSTVPGVFVSTNNGATFYNTSGDYIAADSAGSAPNTSGFSLAGSNSTSARTGSLLILGANVTGAPRVGYQPGNNPTRLFLADNANDIDAIRVAPFAGGATVFTAGSIYVYTR